MPNIETKCVFCGSRSRGKNCPYSAFNNHVHVHTGDPTRCSFCGSKTIIGPNCPYSPTGKHMAGANFFNSMATESFIQGYVMKKLVEPITNSPAFQMGIIDIEGNMLRKPETLDEQMAFTAIDSYLLKLKKLLGNKVDLLNNDIYLEAAIKTANLPIELYDKEVKAKTMMKIIVKHFNEVVNESLKDLPITTVEKIILESFEESC